MNMSPGNSSDDAPTPNRHPLWKYLLAGLAICLIVVLWQIFVPGKTPAIKTQNGVASLEKVLLGGVEQWILIRGEDATNPVLLFLHGGPGSPVMPIAHHYGRELERHFVVVHWDQRGGGKSYSSSLLETSFTIDRFVSDTHELTELLRKRFAAPRIYLVGHSWGSALGVLTVQRYPDLFYAYVGMGQVVDEPRAEQIGLQFVLDKARELGNEEALRELADLDPPYIDNPRDVQIQRKWLSEFGGNFKEGETLPFLSDFNAEWVWLALRSPEYSWLDLTKFLRGNSRVRWALFREFKQVNLMESAPRLEVPVYIFVGRYDYNTPVELVEEYFEKLDAPKGKHLIWFEDSGHTPFLEEPERYAKVMVSRVLRETFQKSDTDPWSSLSHSSP
jgi:pimeloyl-ACP methyl ester carboxylesterase